MKSLDCSHCSPQRISGDSGSHVTVSRTHASASTAPILLTLNGRFRNQFSLMLLEPSTTSRLILTSGMMQKFSQNVWGSQWRPTPAYTASLCNTLHSQMLKQGCNPLTLLVVDTWLPGTCHNASTDLLCMRYAWPPWWYSAPSAQQGVVAWTDGTASFCLISDPLWSHGDLGVSPSIS